MKSPGTRGEIFRAALSQAWNELGFLRYNRVAKKALRLISSLPEHSDHCTTPFYKIGKFHEGGSIDLWEDDLSEETISSMHIEINSDDDGYMRPYMSAYFSEYDDYGSVLRRTFHPDRQKLSNTLSLGEVSRSLRVVQKLAKPIGQTALS